MFAVYPNFAVDTKTEGLIVWETILGGGIRSSAALSPDGILYVGCEDGKLYAIQSRSRGLAKQYWPKWRHNNFNSGSVEYPTPPSNLNVRQIPDNQIHLTWQDNSSDEMGFLLLVKEPPFPSPVQEVTVKPGFTSYQWNWKPENLGKPHSFKVAAFNDNGRSAFTEELILAPVHLIPSVVLRYPNEKEKWLEGEERVIKWNWPGDIKPHRVSVLLSANGGSSWQSLHSEETVPNTGFLEVVVPSVNSDHCLVKVQGGEYYDLSNEAFSIRAALP